MYDLSFSINIFLLSVYVCLYLKHVSCKNTLVLGLVFYPFWQELLACHFISVFFARLHRCNLPSYCCFPLVLSVLCCFVLPFSFFLDCSIVFWFPFYLLCWLFSHICLFYLFSSFPRDYNTHLEHTSVYLGLLLGNFYFLIWLHPDLPCITGDPLCCMDSSGDAQPR